MSTATQDPPSATPFEAAKQVYEAIKGLKAPQQEQALRWAAELLGLVIPVAPKTPTSVATSSEPTTPTPPPPAGDEAVDIASFVESKDPRSDTQFVAVIAYYFKVRAPEPHRRDTIDSSVVEDAITDTHWNGIPSAKVTLNNAKKQGYLKSAARGEFTLTAVGHNLVAKGLPVGQDEMARPTRKLRKPAKKRGPGKRSAAKKAPGTGKRG
jgi:hypothetical protein